MIREDPRVNIAVPICSLPSESLGRHLLWRVDSLTDKSTYVPTAVRDFFRTNPPKGTYAGKKILSLHGGLDAMVPWQNGAKDWDAITAEMGAGEADRWVDEAYGHVVSQEMVRRAAEWFWRWGLSSA